MLHCLGTSYWNEEANELFQKVCSAKIIQAELAGYTKNENAPAVVLFYVDEDKNVSLLLVFSNF